jgi:gliding motility-associated-like protein
VSVVVYGQNGPGLSGSEIQIKPIKTSSFSAPLVENEAGFQEVIDGMQCVTLTYYENDGVVPIEDEISLSSVSGTQLVSATVHLYYNFKPEEDSLVFIDQNGITGSYDAEQGIMELTGLASLADYQIALSSVGYINTSEDPDTDLRKVKFYANNGSGNNNFDEIYIEVIPVNDPPVISGSDTILPYYPLSGVVEIDTMISIIDVDDTHLVKAWVWISNHWDPDEDLIAAAEQYGITVTYDVTAAKLIFTGIATLEEYEEILSAATYLNYNPDPAPSTRDIAFKVFDDEVRSNIHTRQIEILPVNHPPQIVDDQDVPADTLDFEVFTDFNTEICVKAIDPDDDQVMVTSIISLTGNSIPDNDNLDDLCFTFTPVDHFEGTDTLEVIVCDTGIPSMCDTAILIIQVEPKPDASPYVINPTGGRIDTLYLETDEDVALDFCPDLNNPDSLDITISRIEPAGEGTEHGTMSEVDEGDICLRYEPEENYNGRSEWIIGFCTNTDDPVCDSVVVIIDVLPVNDPPVAVNDTVTTTKNYSYSGNLTDNDYDIDGDNLILNEAPEANPLHGSVDLHSDGTFDYTPDQGYYGDDGFTYVVCDDGDPSLCASADVVIYVEDVVLKVYNAVSPNGDDLNDILYIEGIEYYPNNFLSIYDRYNNLVFETLGYNNTSNSWEGQANKGLSTRDLPGDTYFYILVPGDGTPLLKGFIMLKKD